VVLFPPALREVEAVRRRWDPVMAARIAAHVTIVHDVTDHDRADAALRAAAASTAPIELTLTRAAHWGATARGVYLAVEPHDRGIDSLHRALVDVEDPRWLRIGYRPHLTVVHPRYVAEDEAARSWAELSGWTPRRRVRVERVAVVEMDADGWKTVAQVVLAGRTASPGRPMVP